MTKALSTFLPRSISFHLLMIALLITGSHLVTAAQTPDNESSAKALAVIAKAAENLGGQKYLSVTTQISRGKFSVIREGGVVSFQSFLDILVFPDKERTEFKGKGSKTIQTNSGDTGWIYDAEQDVLKVQSETQIAGFKRTIRTSLDNLLRQSWRGDAELTYVGRRPATLGKRNDVIKLTYKDGFVVEFEFSDDGLPQKSLYKVIDNEGEAANEEDRFAQFNEVSGIKIPFIVDRFTNGSHASRINYESVEINKTVSDSIFTKPAKPKDAKKELKF